MNEAVSVIAELQFPQIIYQSDSVGSIAPSVLMIVDFAKRRQKNGTTACLFMKLVKRSFIAKLNSRKKRVWKHI